MTRPWPACRSPALSRCSRGEREHDPSRAHGTVGHGGPERVLAQQARAIIDAMHTEGVKRLIFIGSMGIYSEVPGEHYRSVLDPYPDSAALIEQSDLDYTILRLGWFTHDEAIDYQTTQKGEPFRGHDVSLNSLSDLIAKLVTSPRVVRPLQPRRERDGGEARCRDANNQTRSNEMRHRRDHANPARLPRGYGGREHRGPRCIARSRLRAGAHDRVRPAEGRVVRRASFQAVRLSTGPRSTRRRSR